MKPKKSQLNRPARPGKTPKSIAAVLASLSMVSASCGGPGPAGEQDDPFDPVLELGDVDTQESQGSWAAELAQLRNSPVVLEPSEPVGALPSRTWVDSMGAAHYAIPIDVAPGPNGFAPSLELHYTSEGGNGLYGHGFSVDAAAQISRCQRTLAKDGYYEELHMDDRDPVCLNGERLVLDTGVYGQAGSTYRLETGLSSRVRLEAGSLDDSTSTAIWELDTAGGQTHAFRSYDAVRGRWLLDSITDAFGNRMEYHWAQYPNHETILESIEYGGDGSVQSAPRRKVIFETETRPDLRQGYIRGEKYELTQRVTEIRAEGPHGAVVSRYELDYGDVHPNTLQSTLASVTRLDAAGVALPPTTFEWTGELSLGVEQSVNSASFAVSDWVGGFGTSERLGSRGTAAIADLNGDSKTDILVFDGGQDLYRVDGAFAYLNSHESTRPGGWDSVVSDERELVEHQWFLDSGISWPVFDFEAFLGVYRGNFDDDLFDSVAQYEAFRSAVRADLGASLTGRFHQVQPQLGISRIKFHVDTPVDQLLVPISTESPLESGLDPWGVSVATLLRVALPTSDWQDPDGPGHLEFTYADFPLPPEAPAYSVVTLEYNGDGRDDLFVCQGNGYKSSRWHLWQTRDVANTPGGTYGWDVEDTGVACSSHDEYTVLPHERGTEVLAVIPRFTNHPEPDAFASNAAYRDSSAYTNTESSRTGYRLLEFDATVGDWALSASEVLPRDRYQRTADRFCNNGTVAAQLTDANPPGQGAPLLGAGLSRDRSIDVNGDGLLDLVRLELSGGDDAANEAAIGAEVAGAGTGYASRVPDCASGSGQNAVLRVYENTGDGYAATPPVFEFAGSPHANAWINWYGANFVDWNADGLTDIAIPSDGVPTADLHPERDWVLLLSKGDGSFEAKEFFGVEWPHYVDGGDIEAAFAEQHSRRSFVARDDDGGVRQVFVERYNAPFPDGTGGYGNPPTALRSQQDEGARLVRATDGFGQWNAFVYKAMPNGRRVVRSRAVNAPSVENVDADGVHVADRNWLYEYLGPVLGPDGREVGYSSIRETEARGTFPLFFGTPLEARTVQRRFFDWTYDPATRSYPYASTPSTVETYLESAWYGLSGAGRLSCQRVENWALETQTIAGGQIWQAYPESTESFMVVAPGYDQDSESAVSQCGGYSATQYLTHSTSAQTLDDYGNLVESTQRVLEGVNEDVETTTLIESFDYDHGSWTIAAPKLVTTTERVGADTKVRRAAAWYLPHSTIPEFIYRELGTEYEQQARLEYDDHGNVKLIESFAPGADARIVRTTWDAEGVTPLTTENSLGHVMNHVVDPVTGLSLATVDPNGFTQKTTYDGFFRPVGGSFHASPMGASDGAEVDIGYAASSVPGAVFDEIIERRGQRTVTSYDVAGRVVRDLWKGVQTSSAFPVSPLLAGSDTCRWHEYDVYNNELGTSEATSSCSAPPLGDEHWVRRRFDASNRNVETEWLDDGFVVQTTASFDAASWPGVAAGLGIDAVDGRSVRTVDADGHTSTTVVDALGRTSATIDALGTMTCFDYGPFSELQAVTRNCAYGASGPVETSTYTYDGISRLMSWTEPARGVQAYTYTPYDELESITDAKGQTIEHIYDDLGRLRVRKSPDCTARWSFDGDLIGALSYQISEDGVRDAFTYDEFGRVVRTEHDVPGVEPDGSWAFEFGYDAEGRLGSLTYPSGVNSPLGADAPAAFSVAFDYDGADHLRSVRGAGRVLWALNAANEAGQPLLETFNVNHSLPSQSRTSSYHAFTQRIDAIQVQAGAVDVQHFDHEWSHGGNLLHRAELTTGQQETFGYDALDRLTTIDGNTVASYDVLGNFTSRDGVGQYDHDAATGRLTWFGDPSNTVQHDANGNVEKIGDLQLTWNPFDKVERISRNGEQLDFTYDANGSRAARFDGTGFTLTLGGLFEFSDDVGGTDEGRARYFVPAGGSKIEVRDIEGAAGGWDREVLYQHTDALGSGSVLVADDGTVARQVSYDAWGQARDWDQWDQSFDPSLLQELASGYTGHQPELDAGLINMRGRMYSPEIARFLSVDPVVESLGDAQTWNAYSYVLNNPLRYTDPSGYRACNLDICRAIGGGGDISTGRGGRGRRGRAGNSETDAAAGQNLPGYGDGQTGSTDSSVATGAGGYGGRSGVGSNPRGEGGPSNWSDAQVEFFHDYFPPKAGDRSAEVVRSLEKSIDLFLRVATPAGRLFTIGENVYRAARSWRDGRMYVALDSDGQVAGTLYIPPLALSSEDFVATGVFLDADFSTVYMRALAREQTEKMEPTMVGSGPGVPVSPMAGKRIGHTFTKHGSANTEQLLHQAKGSGLEVGQWLDDAAAERFIAERLDQLKNGAKTFDLPKGMGRVVNPDGTFTPATKARLVPSGSGVKTAYPMK